ncbi:Hypothetical protein CINCED_3A001514 [Cinara cedri]|uniref:Uncharacterized protein n=1 Tax=Cinara cedri TaxID=506608 RepID=A0A5E4MLA0_9HEMI|nr:Hypothetical protein CINCED_3A001514 [Cinara cedri]
MNRLKQPKELQSEKDWLKWKNGCDIYLLTSGSSKLLDEEKIVVLLHYMGQESGNIYVTLEGKLK